MVSGKVKVWKKWLLPLLILVSVLICQQFPLFVEKYYSQILYPFMGRMLRYLFGWIPFSIGDTVVVLLVSWLLWKLTLFIRFIFSRKKSRKEIVLKLLGVVRVVLWAYLLFMLLWGLNYHRLGTGYLLQLQKPLYDTAKTTRLQQVMLQRLQQLAKDSSLIRQQSTRQRESLVGEALQGFARNENVLRTGPFAATSFKPHLIGKWQSYMGYAGYYFPFTGEAHANLYAPEHSLPFTVTHEMAHQLGFAHESEANLVAYLVNRESQNVFFRYSTYYALYHYALAEHYKHDSVMALQMDMAIPAMVKEDRLRMKAFAEAHEHPLQPVLDVVYNQYLLWNKQPEGLQAYNRVVAWLIAYAEKYGWDKI